MQKIISYLLLSLGLMTSGLFIGYGFYASKGLNQTVEVKGLAEQIVKADEALWTINIKLVNNDLSALYRSIDDAQKKVIKFLTQSGFSDLEINVNPLMVVDNQSNTFNQNTNVVRYSADTGITVNSNKVDLVSEKLQQTGDLVAEGIVVTGSNALYRFNGLNNIKPAMLVEAIKNAREAANTFALNANAKLGKIRHASQGLFTINDHNSNFDSGVSIMKKIRVVTSIDYEIK